MLPALYWLGLSSCIALQNRTQASASLIASGIALNQEPGGATSGIMMACYDNTILEIYSDKGNLIETVDTKVVATPISPNSCAYQWCSHPWILNGFRFSSQATPMQRFHLVGVFWVA